MKDIVIIKNSNTLLGNDIYFPDISKIDNGELILNNSADKEALFIKNDNNVIIPFRSKAYTLNKINSVKPTITYSETAPIKPKQGDIWIEPIPPIPFTLEYTTTTINESITLPCSGSVNITVDWGDGSAKEIFKTDKPQHSYLKPGVYIVKIIGDFISMNKSSYNVTKVISWGNTNNLLTYMSFAFIDCSNLTSIPTDEYEAFINVTTFDSTFANCSGLTGSIPEGLFDYSLNVTDFNGTFYGCRNLTSIPQGLFDNCPKVTSFSGVFNSCSGLTSIPIGLFDKNVNVTTFYYAFVNCTNLTSIPQSLFDNCPNVTDFSNTFQNCYNLTGTVPYDSLGGTQTSTPLYDRSVGVNGYVKPTVFYGCFFNCTKLSDYSSIPSSWK